MSLFFKKNFREFSNLKKYFFCQFLIFSQIFKIKKMKKFFAAIFWLNFCSGFFAENYPEKLGNFADIENFRGIYKKIYDDIFLEVAENSEISDEISDEILARILENNFLDDPIFLQNFSPTEIADLCRGENPFSENVSFEKFAQISIKMRRICEFEREMIFFEKNLARRLGLLSIFRNHSNEDSPFDFAAVFDNLDLAFFGKFAQFFEPKFAAENFKNPEKDFLETEPECWQDQRIDSEISGCEKISENPEFEPNDVSIASALAFFVSENPKGPLTELSEIPHGTYEMTKAFLAPSATTIGLGNSFSPQMYSQPVQPQSSAEISEIKNESPSEIFASEETELFLKLNYASGARIHRVDESEALKFFSQQQKISDAEKFRKIREKIWLEMDEKFYEKISTEFGKLEKNFTTFFDAAQQFAILMNKLKQK